MNSHQTHCGDGLIRGLIRRIAVFGAAIATALAIVGLVAPVPAYAASEWYMAEGTVRPGWVEYITIQALDGPQTVTISFQATTDFGTVSPAIPDKVYAGVAAATRLTLNVNDWLTANAIPTPLNISFKVVATGNVRVERPMYFNADAGLSSVINGGTDAVAAPAPNTEFYFAEGTVRPGFQEYITVQNPPANPTTFVTVTFQASTDAGSLVPIPPKNFSIVTNFRYTFNVSAYIASLGVTYPINISTKVTADYPVVAERPMYFKFTAPSNVNAEVNGGTTLIGATSPATENYFAEGTYRAGWLEYLTIQNPGTLSANDVTISFQASDDAGLPYTIIPNKHFGGVDPPIPAGSRLTINVNQYMKDNNVPMPMNIAIKVVSDEPLVVERPMYFNADPGLGTKVNDGTTVIGVQPPTAPLYFAEGTVRPGFIEYITIQNPNGAAATATLTFQVFDDAGAPVIVAAPPGIVVPANGRVTFNVSAYFASLSVTTPVNVSTKVDSTLPVVAERPMYFSFMPPGISTVINGGTSVVGAP